MRYWIVVEWNQASSQPRVVGGDMHWSEADAEDVAEQMREETRVIGRHERFTVHPVEEE